MKSGFSTKFHKRKYFYSALFLYIEFFWSVHPFLLHRAVFFCHIFKKIKVGIMLPVIPSVKLWMFPSDLQPEIDRHIIHCLSRIDKLRFHTIFQSDNGYRTLSQGFTVIFPQINIIHIVIINDESCRMLMYLRHKFHLRRYRCINTCKLSCQNTHLIQRGSWLLSP